MGLPISSRQNSIWYDLSRKLQQKPSPIRVASAVHQAWSGLGRRGAAKGTRKYLFAYYCMGVEPRIGGVFPPKWMVKIMEKPMNKWMIWGAHPYFWKHPYSIYILSGILPFVGCHHCQCQANELTVDSTRRFVTSCFGGLQMAPVATGFGSFLSAAIVKAKGI